MFPLSRHDLGIAGAGDGRETGAAMRDTPARRHEPVRYESRFHGHLARRWAPRFDGMTLTAHDDGTTVMGGLVVDQAALYGLRPHFGDAGPPLTSVIPMVPEPQTPATAAPAPLGA